MRVISQRLTRKKRDAEDERARWRFVLLDGALVLAAAIPIGVG